MAADRRLFFLFLRALGVYCLVEGIREFVESLQYDLTNGVLNSEWVQIWCQHLPSYCSAIVMLGAAGYLLLGGGVLLNHSAPAREGLCWDCHYDLTGNSSGRCSECGRLVGQAISPATRSVAVDPPWYKGSPWGRRIVLVVAVIYLCSVALGALLQKMDVIVTEPRSGRLCFAWDPDCM